MLALIVYTHTSFGMKRPRPPEEVSSEDEPPRKRRKLGPDPEVKRREERLEICPFLTTLAQCICPSWASRKKSYSLYRTEITDEEIEGVAKKVYPEDRRIQAEVVAQRERRDQDEASAHWIEEHTKPCPNCGVPIEKVGGCDDMYCKNCQCGFRWACPCCDMPFEDNYCENCNCEFLDCPRCGGLTEGSEDGHVLCDCCGRKFCRHCREILEEDSDSHECC